MRIGVDVDGVLTNIGKYQLEKAKEYFKGKKEEDLKLDEYDVEEIFGISHKERNKFWTKYIFDYCKSPMRYDASATLNKLHEEGDEIYIITGRVHTLEKGFLGYLFRKMLIDWLDENHIPYKEIVYCNEKGSEVDKIEAIKKYDIDVLIDDKRENIEEASKITRVLCFDAPYNQNCEGENITRVHSFNDVYLEIERMKGKTSFVKLGSEEIANLSDEEKEEYIASAREFYSELPYEDDRIKNEEKNYVKGVKLFSGLFNLLFKPVVFNKEFVPSESGMIFASNHNNYYDQFPIITSLGKECPVHFLTATKMLNMKRGKYYLKTGVIPVDRKDQNDRTRSSDEMKKILLHGGNVGIFPEGRTNRGEAFLLDFHPGAVATAQITGAPIIPVAVNDNYSSKSGPLCVRFGRPMYISPTDDIIEKTEELKEIIGDLKQQNINYVESQNKEQAPKMLLKRKDEVL